MLLFFFPIFRRRLRYYEKEVGYNTYESCKKLTEKDRFEIKVEVKSPAPAEVSHTASGWEFAAQSKSVLFGVQKTSSNIARSQVKKPQFTTRVASYACLREMQNL